jgi:hypothetical protein
MDFQFSSRTHFASLLFSSLVSQSPSAKSLARAIIPASSAAAQNAGGGGRPGHTRSDSAVVFVPADVDLEKLTLIEQEEKERKEREKREKEAEDSGDETLTLMQILTEYTSLAFVIRSKMQDPPHGEPPGEERDWVGSPLGCVDESAC